MERSRAPILLGRFFQREAEPALKAFRRIGRLEIALDRADRMIDQDAAETLARRRRDDRAGLLPPGDRRRSPVELRLDLDLPLGFGKRAVLDGIGRQFMQHQNDMAREIRRQLEVRSAEAPAVFAERGQLTLQQRAQERGRLGRVGRQVAGAFDGLQARCDCLGAVGIVPERASDDRFDHRIGVAPAMLDLFRHHLGCRPLRLHALEQELIGVGKSNHDRNRSKPQGDFRHIGLRG
jgi:hypothetical protein